MGEGGHTYALVPESDGLQSLPPSLRRRPLPMPCRKVPAGSCKGPARLSTEPDGALWCLVVVLEIFWCACCCRPRRGRQSTHFRNFRNEFSKFAKTLFLGSDPPPPWRPRSRWGSCTPDLRKSSWVMMRMSRRTMTLAGNFPPIFILIVNNKSSITKFNPHSNLQFSEVPRDELCKEQKCINRCTYARIPR